MVPPVVLPGSLLTHWDNQREAGGRSSCFPKSLIERKQKERPVASKIFYLLNLQNFLTGLNHVLLRSRNLDSL